MNSLNGPKIAEIARSLGLAKSVRPSASIMHYCEQRVHDFLNLLPDCSTPAQLLNISAGMLGAQFRCITSDNDLADLIGQYCERRELGFANLVQILGPTTYGVTIRLRHAPSYEPQFVCVIDCRGTKGLRSYFTKWHELCHLLILTDQARSTFFRTHTDADFKDAEEVLVDYLAGYFGFFPQFLKRELTGHLSLVSVDAIRQRLFPESSFSASAIACVKNHAEACLLIDAKVALSERQRARKNQESFGFLDAPEPKLRAVNVVSSDSARTQRFTIPRNYRIPEASVIHQVHLSGADCLSGIESLSEWKSSDGRQLPATKVVIEARRAFDGVIALVHPERDSSPPPVTSNEQYSRFSATITE